MISDKLSNELNKYGVYEIRYYNLNKGLIKIYDACILIDKNNHILSRGISICSLLDRYIKKTGRDKSLGRAIKALKNKESSDLINPIRLSDDKFIKKSIRVKTKEESIKLKNQISEFKPIKKELNNNIIEYTFKIPLLYPILETVKEFKYKSQFLPIPTKYEETIIKKIEKK